MKIVMVSDAVYPYNKGGKEKRIYEISTRLALRGHDVHIYCMKWWKGKELHRFENGVHLNAISKYYPLYSGKRRSIKEAVMFSISCLKLMKEDFDVMDVDHMPHLVLFPLKIVAILKRKKLIATWNEVWGRKYWIEYMGMFGNVSAFIEKISILLPDKIISVSNHTTNNLIKKMHYAKSISTIPNGIDTVAIESVEASREKFDIIFAGRLLAHKNLDVLINSVAILKNQYPQIKCIIVGNGPEKMRLKEMVEDLNLKENVFFLDFLENHNDLYSLMKSSRVFVLPSTREGFGIVVLEANACGIPVVTISHRENAAKDLIKNGNGIVCNLDEEEIARSITNLLKSNAIPKNSPNLARSYDWNKITKQIETVYSL